MSASTTHGTPVNVASIHGKYRPIFELGRGGMANVILAVVQGPGGFNKLQVIKQLRSELALDPEFLTMFLDEARLSEDQSLERRANERGWRRRRAVLHCNGVSRGTAASSHPVSVAKAEVPRRE